MSVIKLDATVSIRRADRSLGHRENFRGFLDINIHDRQRLVELGVIRSRRVRDYVSTKVIPHPKLLVGELHLWIPKSYGFLPRPNLPPSHQSDRVPEGIHVLKKQEGKNEVRVAPYFGPEVYWELLPQSKDTECEVEYHTIGGFLRYVIDPTGLQRYHARHYGTLTPHVLSELES